MAIAMLTAGATMALAAPAAANQPPVTEIDTYRLPSTKESLAVRGPGILANDTDPDGDPLTAQLLGDPTYGTVALARNGGFRYTPPPGFSGLDSFDYLARDSPTTVSRCCGHVYIIVTQPPRATDDSYAAISGRWRIIDAPGVLGNDVGDRARLADGPGHGTARISPSGRLAYRPDPGFVGTDTFTYEALIRGEQPDTATVEIRVKSSNEPPAPVADTYATEEDTPIIEAAPGVAANDVDPDGDPLTVELVQPPYADSFELRPDGSFEFYPPPDFDSPVSFTYRVNDGLAWSAPVRADIEISAVDDPPYGEEDIYYLNRGSSLDVSAPGVLANDYDTVEGDALSARLYGRGTRRGTLDLRPNGSFTYERDPGATGGDRFRYRVADSGGAVGNVVWVTILPGIG